MGPLAALVLALAAAHVQVAAGTAQQCYVCEPRTGGTDGSLSTMFHDQPPLLKCEDFKKDDKRFVKNCPKGSSAGCLTQSIGNHVTRTCGDQKVNDCQVANGVQYCYCIGLLCNDGQSQHDPPPDDEDATEGSASGEDTKKRSKDAQGTPLVTSTSVAPPTTHAHQVSGSATRTNCNLTTTTLLMFVSCLVVLVNGVLRPY